MCRFCLFEAKRQIFLAKRQTFLAKHKEHLGGLQVAGKRPRQEHPHQGPHVLAVHLGQHGATQPGLPSGKGISWPAWAWGRAHDKAAVGIATVFGRFSTV
jgi:hypothetical protein